MDEAIMDVSSRGAGTSPAALGADLSLYHLLDPEILANPYPFYRRLQVEAPVFWDPYLHVWVVTRYADVVQVLTHGSSKRTPTPDYLRAIGLEELTPLANVMVKQLIFLDPPDHTRLRALAAKAFSPRQVEALREHIQEIADDLIGAAAERGTMEVYRDLAYPLPAIVTAEVMGLPARDREQIKQWCIDFAEVLGSFQYDPDQAPRAVQSLTAMLAYFQEQVADHRAHPRDDLISAYLEAEVNGDHFSDEEVVANCIITTVGGHETTTSLIINGLYTLLRHPDQLALLQQDPAIIPEAIEELLRFESPIQQTARLAPKDMAIGGQLIRQGQGIFAVIGAANRDPERFVEPDQVDVRRRDNRHVAFAWGSHFCFGAPLARVEAHIIFETLLRRFSTMTPLQKTVQWSSNNGFRCLSALNVAVTPA